MQETTKSQTSERQRRELPPSIRKESREMVLRPSRWPHWPILPVKRYSREGQSFPEFGVIYWGSLSEDPSETSKLTVTLRNLFVTNIPAEGFEHIEYANVDAMLDDGWEVD